MIKTYRVFWGTLHCHKQYNFTMSHITRFSKYRLMKALSSSNYMTFYSTVPNWRGYQIIEVRMRGGKNLENLTSGGGGKLEKQYLKMRYRFKLSIPKPGLIHSFSMRIYFWHTEVSYNTFNRYMFGNFTVAKIKISEN